MTEQTPPGVRVATTDRRTAATMTAREVHERLVRAHEGNRRTVGAWAELNAAEDLMDALDEELAKLREFARRVAALGDNDLDFAARETLTELAEDLDLGWEARA